MYNKYGKINVNLPFRLTADLAASTVIEAGPSATQRDNYGPFTNIRVTNDSTKAIEISLDAGTTTATALQTHGRHYVLQPKSVWGLEIGDNVLFYRVYIKNLDTATAIDIATTATERVFLDVGNQTE